MQIVFFTSTTTPLYSTSWSPSSRGQYAATCIFLIALAIIFKLLLAQRAKLEHRWQQMEGRRRYKIAGVEKKTDQPSEEESTMDVIKKKVSGVRPWRTRQDIPRAGLDVVIAGVGYLL